jgi:hypothetical protein
MSHKLISRSPDLKQLRDEGYDLEVVKSNHLLVKSIPYVDSKGHIHRGTLVSELTISGETAAAPGTHVVYFAGEFPCHKDGTPIAQLLHTSGNQDLGNSLVVNHSFSNKPPQGYPNYYEKMKRYIEIISHPAQAIDGNVTARIYPAVASADEESVFTYLDTASSRAGITAAMTKLEIGKVGIVGVGGTGSYVLDFVSKTPVKEIHLFDGDKFLNHNAFRSPGAAGLEDLMAAPLKVDYLKGRYSKMHRGIVSHAVYLDASTVDQLLDMDFVFLCLDKGEPKRLLIERLEAKGTRFIDVGMGVTLVDGSLLGHLRVTTSTPQKRDHVRRRVQFADDGADDEYSQNIQIADLNALNAALAVIKWKKLFGFYYDPDQEHHCTYTLSGNRLNNEDAHESSEFTQA